MQLLTGLKLVTCFVPSRTPLIQQLLRHLITIKQRVKCPERTVQYLQASVYFMIFIGKLWRIYGYDFLQFKSFTTNNKTSGFVTLFGIDKWFGRLCFFCENQQTYFRSTRCMWYCLLLQGSADLKYLDITSIKLSFISLSEHRCSATILHAYMENQRRAIGPYSLFLRTMVDDIAETNRKPLEQTPSYSMQYPRPYFRIF